MHSDTGLEAVPKDGRLAVYTLAIGGLYDLPAVQLQSDVDYICFSDQDLSAVPGWEIRPAALLLPGDTFRSSRDYKIRPHRFLSEYARSIYVDSSVRLECDPKILWDRLIPSQKISFGAIHHSFRTSLSDEFDKVEEAKLDYAEVLDEQRWVYGQLYPEVLKQKPVWGGVLARRHGDERCKEAMEQWFANILRYSRRDQLSLLVALARLPEDEKHILAEDIRSSRYHSWPVSNLPKPSGYKVRETDGLVARKLRRVLRLIDAKTRSR